MSVIHRVGWRRQLWRLGAAASFAVVGATTPPVAGDWYVPIVAAVIGFACLDGASE